MVDGYGHVSVRNPANPNHFWISRWLAPDLVTRSDIVELDFDCVPINGDTRSSTASAGFTPRFTARGRT